MKKQRQLPVGNFKPEEGFISKYQRLVKEVMLPYQYRVLCDAEPGAEKSHVIDNFRNAGKVLRGEKTDDGFYGMVFQDSDAAKWLEAVAYALKLYPDNELEAQADELIELIANAQDEDGYLDTYFTIKDRDLRWTNLLEGHELYCMGHMMEAAVAYYETTGKDRLLKVMEKNAEHIYEHFVTENNPGYPGHPEVELALLRLYDATGNEKALKLAGHFIDIRGVDTEFYAKEKAKRSWTVWGNDAADLDYMQAAAPVRDQKDAVGHAVRAVYLYTAMADLAGRNDDEELKAACDRLFKSITDRRMYITGGIGSTNMGEAFTVDYDLPNDTAYCESCASCGLIFFASRMLEQDVDGKYGDVMERAFYNTVLAGMQLTGDGFFYVNPLEAVPGVSGVAKTHPHTLIKRPGWYACACCPPNIARLICSFGKYAFGEGDGANYCHMYTSGRVSFSDGMEIICRTGYPYEGSVRFEITKGTGCFKVRIPGWCGSCRIKYNGIDMDVRPDKGYVSFENAKAGDTILVELDMPAEFNYCSNKVSENTGCVSISRGPLVYCFEGVDNDGDVFGIRLDDEADMEVGAYDEKLLGGIVPITVSAFRREETKGLYSNVKPKSRKIKARAVPYYAWSNRGSGQMRVWMPY